MVPRLENLSASTGVSGAVAGGKSRELHTRRRSEFRGRRHVSGSAPSTARGYDCAARQFHGSKAKTNFPLPSPTPNCSETDSSGPLMAASDLGCTGMFSFPRHRQRIAVGASHASSVFYLGPPRAAMTAEFAQVYPVRGFDLVEIRLTAGLKATVKSETEASPTVDCEPRRGLNLDLNLSSPVDV